MNINDALNLLSLSSKATQAEIKKAYKAASLKFHPDRNPAGEKMMIAINEAYNTLKDLGETVTANEHFKENNYAEELNEVLNALFTMAGIIVEICGNWVWISGKTKEHKEALKKLSCRWASKKKLWYFRPEEFKSFSRKSASMDEIRSKYGSVTPKRNSRMALA